MLPRTKPVPWLSTPPWPLLQPASMATAISGIERRTTRMANLVFRFSSPTPVSLRRHPVADWLDRYCALDKAEIHHNPGKQKTLGSDAATQQRVSAPVGSFRR